MEFRIAIQDLNQASFSLDKKNADFANNQIILNSIVGTLVKYGISGRIEPYLAESWTVSTDKRNWEFKIRENLTGEDGTLITAELFKNILTQNLKEYSKRGSTIMFDHLIGWSDFVSGKTESLIGLTSNENIVSFKFDNNPDAFLELLRMPFFGLWVERDQKIISTGPYSIKNFNEKSVTLTLRKSWFTINEESVKEVKISFVRLDEQRHLSNLASITKLPFFVEAADFKDGYWIVSPPTRLESFVLSPTKHSFFHKLKNRQIFYNRILSLYPSLVKSNFFYQSAKSSTLKYSKDTRYDLASESKPLAFALERATYSESEILKLNDIISHALNGSGVEYKLVPRDFLDKEWLVKRDSNNYFDARVASVDIGASPLYAAIKMMFCTKLGINFPDPSGRICELVSKGIASSTNIDQSFIDQFNQILYDASVVIPIQHHSDKWFVSNDIDPRSLPPTTLYPQFELIRAR